MANLWLLLVLAPVAMPSSAFDETLSFRRNLDGSYEAVVSGLSDGPSCETEFVPPSDIDISGATIAIVSPYESYACSIPMTAVPYEVVADLGQLAGPSYEVTWTEGPLQVAGTLIPSGVGLPVAAPASSWLSLACMGMLLAALALAGFRKAARGTLPGHMRPR